MFETPQEQWAWAMVVTIDGPAGAGKSSVARELARRLGFRFLDTGAMYRAVAWAALREEIDWRNSQQLVELAGRVQLELRGDQVLVDGEDVSQAIRRSDVTGVVHYVADNPRIRQRLVQLQREVVQGMDIVTEGRDQGTVVFPEADCKFFLTASPLERARRRVMELNQRGEDVGLQEVLDQQQDRDRRDCTREFGRLARAEDAMEVVTDGMTVDEVACQLEKLVRQRRPE